MGAPLNLRGVRFGRWVAIAPVKDSIRRGWLCRCDCGTERVVYTGHLRNGASVSCGCYNREVCSGPRPERRGGPSTHPLHLCWRKMKSRCQNPRDAGYVNYGARGISVCPEWGEFETFVRDMGPRPPGMSLDRVDNAGGYGPKNCRWATPAQQSRNRRGVVRLTVLGETKTANEWSNTYGYPNTVSAILSRVRRGWDHAFAVFLPPERVA